MTADSKIVPIVRERPKSVAATLHLDTLIQRFDPALQTQLKHLVLKSERLEDLATVFPAALHMLAGRYGAADGRKKALACVVKGRPLRDVARHLKLPMWTRRLPPEAFRGDVGQVPGSELLSRRIINQLPRPGDNPAFWLQSVSFASMACDDYFALWLARQRVFYDRGSAERLFGLLAAYAWYSSRGSCRTRDLIGALWQPEMAFETAVCAAKSWLNRMRLVIQLREGVISDTWLLAGEAHGLSFVPLVDEAQILLEARQMGNCADQYSDRIARDKCRLFSVRRNGARLATLEIGPHAREAGILAINQLKSRHNAQASHQIWRATYAWMSTQPELKHIPNTAIGERGMDGALWQALLSDYRVHADGAPWLPTDASRENILCLEADVADLARRAGISSWLFT